MIVRLKIRDERQKVCNATAKSSVDGTPLPEVRCIRCATGTKSSEGQITCVPSDKTALLLGKLNCEFTVATY